jgi:hypothetical protein
VNRSYQPKWLIGAKIGSIVGVFIGTFVGVGFLWSIWGTWDDFSLSELIFLAYSMIFIISLYILAGATLGGLVGLVRNKMRFQPWVSMLIAGAIGGTVWSLGITILTSVWNKREPLSETLQSLVAGMIIGLFIAFFLEGRIQRLKNKP